MANTKSMAEVASGREIDHTSMGPPAVTAWAPALRIANKIIECTSSIMAAAQTNCPMDVWSKSKSFITTNENPMPVEA